MEDPLDPNAINDAVERDLKIFRHRTPPSTVAVFVVATFIAIAASFVLGVVVAILSQ